MRSYSSAWQLDSGVGAGSVLRALVCLFKLRIGLAITLAALAGYAVTPGASAGWSVTLLAVSVLLSAAIGGALNQYWERDVDSRMARTRHRPFVSGRFEARPAWWLGLVAGLCLTVAAAGLINPWTALYVGLGAFTYVVIYTIWLKRRTWWNIVVGGLAGSFAVLAGSAAVDPALSPAAMALALVLFLWTPTHFWSLGLALKDQYRDAGIPMLPVVHGDRITIHAIFVNTVLLLAASLVPVAWGLGGWYLAGAVAGGGYLLYTNLRLVRAGTRAAALTAFYASLVQLTALLAGAIVDIQVLS